jgi:hypothetical protein
MIVGPRRWSSKVWGRRAEQQNLPTAMLLGS